MRPEFELNHLKYFYFTVIDGGVAPAAARLHVQQPVISKMLRSLDERFGQPLFRKAGRRKVLTDFGQLIFRHCQNIFHEVEKLDSVRSQSVQLSGPINFGCSEVIAGSQLASSVQKLLKEFPDLHPNVYSSTAHHLVDLILQKKLDFGLFFHLPSLPPGLEIIHKIPLRFYVVVHKSCSRNTNVIEKFIGSREIDDNANQKFPTVERLRKMYQGTAIAISSNNLNFHKQLVMQGFGSAILPEYLIRSELKRDVLYDLFKKEKMYFDFKVVAPKGQSLSLASEKLLKEIISSFAVST